LYRILVRQLRAGLLFLLLLWGNPAASAEAFPALLLAETYRGGIDVSHYLVSEKYDGVRSYWDGAVLWTRGGQRINAPAWFVAGFPKQALDGELWMGRGRFEATSAAIRRSVPDDTEWQQIRYQVFELPDVSGSFVERVQQIDTLLAQAGVPWLVAVPQFRLADGKALTRKLHQVTQAGGEGLMLHRADAPYVTGRSDALLKVKLWLDAEAVVIGHLPGKGRYTGMVGALRVRAEDEREFSLGTGLSAAQRRDPPPVGTTITYRYRELTTNGLPRFASFWRIRSRE
jgi:DNA ligase-1